MAAVLLPACSDGAEDPIDRDVPVLEAWNTARVVCDVTYRPDATRDEGEVREEVELAVGEVGRGPFPGAERTFGDLRWTVGYSAEMGSGGYGSVNLGVSDVAGNPIHGSMHQSIGSGSGWAEDEYDFTGEVLVHHGSASVGWRCIARSSAGQHQGPAGDPSDIELVACHVAYWPTGHPSTREEFELVHEFADEAADERTTVGIYQEFRLEIVELAELGSRELGFTATDAAGNPIVELRYPALREGSSFSQDLITQYQSTHLGEPHIRWTCLDRPIPEGW